MSHETDFAERLIAEFPILNPVLTEHLSDQEGELLPYLLFGDVARWLNTQANEGGLDAITPLLDWLEEEFDRGQFEIRNLIDVGIVEMLPASPDGDEVLHNLGPHLRARAEVAGLL